MASEQDSGRHRNRRKLAMSICPGHFAAALVVQSVLFPDALSDLFQPCSRVCAVNDASQESELRGDVVAVLSNVVFCSFGVLSKEALHAPWLCEYVSGVAQLRSLDDHCLFYIEDVFVAKQVDVAGMARELAIEERVVIGTPTDLS